MFYLGGKKRIGAQIAAVIVELERQRFGGASLPRPYYEPFCGMLGVAAHVAHPRRSMHLLDGHAELITLWRAWQDGWRPPRNVWVSRDEYDRLRRQSAAASASSDDAAWRAFVGFASSHSGKWFGGYIDCDKRSPNVPRCRQNATSMQRTWATLVGNAGGERRARRSVHFDCCAYDRAVTTAEARNGVVVYCDPPYAGTSGYPSVNGRRGFDHARFWQWARRRSLDGALVLVSEQTAPPDFRPVWSRTIKRKMHISDANGGKSRTEHLFIYDPAAAAIAASPGMSDDDDDDDSMTDVDSDA